LVVTDFLANVLWRKRSKSDAHDSIEQILERAYQLTEEGLQKGYAFETDPSGHWPGVPVGGLTAR
jgi:hypothetical protein